MGEERLSRNDFILGVNYLQKFYINNDLQESILDVWYSAFKHLERNVFFAIIKEYCANEEYPPKNPNQLLKYCTFKTGEQVWEWLENLNERYKYDNEFMSSKFFQELSQDKIAYALFKHLFHDRKNVYKNNVFEKERLDFVEIEPNLEVLRHGYDYRKKVFIDAYNRNLKSQNKVYATMIDSNSNNTKMLKG